MQVAIGFGFPSHWLINWHGIFKPITKRSNCILVIAFDSHLKTAVVHNLPQDVEFELANGSLPDGLTAQMVGQVQFI